MNDLELEYQDLVKSFNSFKISNMQDLLNTIHASTVSHIVNETLINGFKKINPKSVLTDSSILLLFDEPQKSSFALWILNQTLLDYHIIKQNYGLISSIDFLNKSKHLKIGIAFNCPHVVLFFLNIVSNEIQQLSSKDSQIKKIKEILNYLREAYLFNDKSHRDGIDHLILALIEVQRIKIEQLCLAPVETYLSNIATARAHLTLSNELLITQSTKITSISLNPEANTISSMLAEYKFKGYDFNSLNEYLDKINDISSQIESPIIGDKVCWEAESVPTAPIG
ncbi:Uncharacterised protein [Legionella busanensis]|uniref:Uncharacterized protein n=1 Tax=Legionella busanensis TaxID=190655 RepID=A0A378JJQ4_9GAMM|nr:hypothetical protein [Legionella busanensis]STX51455.1 Uncharacterised protein [Legionella busanensis]